MATPKPKPVLLFMAHPLTGHITPTLRIASHFSSQNYKVYFLGPTSHKQRITSAGCIFLPLLGSADIDDLAYYTPESPSTGNPSSSDDGGTWQSRALVDFQQIWINPLPDSWRSVTSALSEIFSSGSSSSSSSPELTELTIVSEAMFFGILPLFLNAPLPPPLTSSSLSSIKTVCLSIMVPFIRSPEIGPGFSDSLPFLPSRAAQILRAEEQWSAWAQRTSHLSDLLDSQLLSVGCSTGLSGFGPFLSGANYALLGGRARSDSSSAAAILQLGCPSFFYPRSSWPATFRFIGILPPAAAPRPGGWPNLPTWWDEIVKNHHDDKNKNTKKKKIVVVAQGTVETDPNDLIIPTITAMASDDDDNNNNNAAVTVIAILGRKNASLPADFPLPPNARVTDYLHYDAVLPLADAWVHNAGYGAVQHGIANGVPMVVTGEGQDKADNAKRIAWSGIGINLGRVKPPAEQVKKALEAVLFEDGYRDRVRRMLEESRGLDCFKLAEEAVLRVSG
ncbi:family 1 glycosyltransferase [Cladorrhinum samala]|uniref:Family 1 glycosyltransferase n=1 Tax=Cladorrhinum samala TaxID=585594 RepID=A0AAV9HW93_9PEZI|nr:family 1 glycosyltransferase [Cladorrhinum samala]